MSNLAVQIQVDLHHIQAQMSEAVALISSLPTEARNRYAEALLASLEKGSTEVGEPVSTKQITGVTNHVYFPRISGRFESLMVEMRALVSGPKEAA